ncbi:tetratricopeptide repeat protein [Mucilaginibacter sp. HMF5004]|uniref:tetratricopeptide repeat protein n=1 Tax=Mucilaginibacter rivuli TaxID=2857527 RepID=UPI001C5D3E4D|nr:tetratricopeptide repeat protein [Mucilaginibacter rivuli]MBW4889823.1 tetratricopeptide repeat protein [Mucilaginibacter rivuli]
MNKSGRIVIISIVAVFVVLCMAYSNHFNNGFHFDDSHTIQDNVYIRSLKNIPAFFSHPEMFSANPLHRGLRPLVTTSLAIDYWLGNGLNPFYFQLSTFIWFALLCMFLFLVYKNILQASIVHPWAVYIAVAGMAWFALHPVNAETINYIISRSDVLSTFFIILSLYVYITFPNKRKLYLYVIPAFIGVFAKETTAVLVIILFFYILLFEKKLSIKDLFNTANLKLVFKAIIQVLPLAIVIVVTQLILSSKSPGIGNAFSGSLFYYILTQAYVWLHYMVSFFLPMNLSADSDLTIINNAFDDRIVVGLISIVCLVVAIFKTSVKQETKPITFGLIWFAAALLPTSLVPLAEVTNDHRMFFAFVGLSLSVVTSIGLWLIKNEDFIKTHTLYRGAITAAIFLILAGNAYGVHTRNKVWETEESLWFDVTVKSPMNGRGLMNYGLSQMAKGNYAGAELYFTRALPFLPNYSTLAINLGVLYSAMGKPAQAEEHFKRAINLSPGTDDSYMFYARFLKESNRLTEAQQVAEKAYQINPSALMTLTLLMDIDNTLGQWDKLSEAATQTLNLLPNDKGAQAYLNAAKTHIPVVFVNNQPASKTLTAEDYLNVSLNYYNAKEYNKCIEACEQAIKLKPGYADAYSNMGAAYNMMGQWQKGADACTTALKFAPNHKLAKGNLNWALGELKK